MARMSARVLRCLAAGILAAAAVILVAMWMLAGREEDTPEFCFPAIERASLRCRGRVEKGRPPGSHPKKLELDGHLTSVPWTGHPPRIYKVKGDYYLVQDFSYSQQLYLWSAKGGKLTKLGNGDLIAVPGLGNVIKARYAHTNIICELDLENARFRVLWQEDSGIGLLGQSNGRLVLWTKRGLVILAPGQAPVVRDVKWDTSFVPAGSPAPSTDSVRGNRILVCGKPPYGETSGKPFEVEVGIQNIETGKFRKIGKVPGYWARPLPTGAMYYKRLSPHVAIGWITAAKAKELESQPKVEAKGFYSRHYVVEGTERILTVQAPFALW